METIFPGGDTAKIISLSVIIPGRCLGDRRTVVFPAAGHFKRKEVLKMIDKEMDRLLALLRNTKTTEMRRFYAGKCLKRCEEMINRPEFDCFEILNEDIAYLKKIDSTSIGEDELRALIPELEKRLVVRKAKKAERINAHNAPRFDEIGGDGPGFGFSGRVDEL